MAPLPRRWQAIDQEAASQVRRCHRYLVSLAGPSRRSSRAKHTIDSQTVAAELDDPNRRSLSQETEPDKKKAKVDKKDDTLHQVKWRRIVLDEGHVIKNPKAKMSMAVATLKAE